MILREATAGDLRPLLALCKKAWTQQDIPFDTDIDRFRNLQKQRFRIMVLYDSEEMVAALMAHPLETDQGAGYQIVMFVVDGTNPSKLRCLDALSLYALNVALSEGRAVVVSRRPKSVVTNMLYGNEMLGQTVVDHGLDAIVQIGRAPEMMARIFDRHPEWHLLP